MFASKIRAHPSGLPDVERLAFAGASILRVFGDRVQRAPAGVSHFDSGLFDMNGSRENIQGGHRAFQRGMESIAQRRPVREIAGFCAFVVAYYFAYGYGMSFSQAAASPFWFPDSVLLCALLISPLRRWWILILAILPIRLFSEVAAGIPTWFLLATFAIDAAKGILTALVLRWLIDNPLQFKTVREFALYFLFAVLLVPAAGAFAGAGVRTILGHDFWLSWQQWFLGDVLAQLIITPAILYWVFGAPGNLRARSTKRYVEGGLLAAGLIVTGYLATNTEISSVDFTESRFYAPVPFLFWAAIRFGMVGASGAITLIAFFAVESALFSHGPFSGRSPGDTALALQHFLLWRSAPLYLVAALTEQRWGVERRLRESEDRFRSMANTAPVLLWVADNHKHCEFFNQGWLEFTGRSLEQETATDWLENVHPEDAEHCRGVYFAAFDARERFEIEYRLRRYDGTYHWVLQKGVPRHAPNGDFIGYIGSAIDITDRKQVDEGNRQLAHAQRLVVLGQLSAAIAHEVRQPLAAILSNADAARMMLNSPRPPLGEIRDIIADIRKDDLRADDVIGRIRDFLHKRNPEMKPLDINAAVSEVFRFVAADARKRHVQIRSDLAPGLPLVIGDRTQLQQVLLNLIVNGMDAMQDTSEGSRYLSVRTQSNGKDGIEVAVEDCGSGIPPGDLRRLFEPFFTTGIEGMGLGLAIAQSIIAAHNGRIWAENNSGGGATFHFSIPAAQGQTGRRSANVG
jgi:PAS domain S-box-containing protein